MANNQIAKFYASVGADLKAFEKKTKQVKAEGRKLEKGHKVGIGADISKALSKFKDVGVAIAKIGVAAGAAALAIGAALGGAAYKVGKSFDEAYDKIRVGTGATGDALNKLKDDFRAVVGDTPAKLSDVGTAIADINTRLGLTGPQLQNMARQMLELSRLTGTDLTNNLRLATRVFGDWGISVDDQAEKLDWLFKVSQATGVGFDVLSQNVVQTGTSLRGMGFSFEEATTMLGKWEKEGVNTETILASLKMGLNKMAQKGIPDAKEAFKQLQKEIKEAGSDTEAISLATEYFGSRASADMALAIRENRLELGDLTDTLANSSETIMKAAADTRSWGEEWQIIKNEVFLEIEPIAVKFFDSIGKKAAEFRKTMASEGFQSALAGLIGDNLADKLFAIGGAFSDLGSKIKAFFEDPAVKNLLTSIWINLKIGVSNAKEALVELQPTFERLKPVVEALAIAVGVILISAIWLISASFRGWAVIMNTIVAPALNAVTWAVQSLWDILTPVGADVIGLAGNFSLMDEVLSLLLTPISNVATALTWIKDNAVNPLADAIGTLVGKLGELKDKFNIGGAVTGAVETAAGFLIPGLAEGGGPFDKPTLAMIGEGREKEWVLTESQIGALSNMPFVKLLTGIKEKVMGAIEKVKGLLGIDFGGAGAGVGQWAGTVLSALAMTGHPASWLQGILTRMQQESGGNPFAINNWDSNAAAGDPSRGLMQTIFSTFSAYHQPGTSWDIYNPLANIAAAINYIASRYGSPYNLPTGGYANGGVAGMHGPELALLGEREEELVVPFSKLGGMGGINIHNMTVVTPNARQFVRDLGKLNRSNKAGYRAKGANV